MCVFMGKMFMYIYLVVYLIVILSDFVYFDREYLGVVDVFCYKEFGGKL